MIGRTIHHTSQHLSSHSPATCTWVIEDGFFPTENGLFPPENGFFPLEMDYFPLKMDFFPLRYRLVRVCNCSMSQWEKSIFVGNNPFSVGNDPYSVGNDPYSVGNNPFSVGNNPFSITRLYLPRGLLLKCWLVWSTVQPIVDHKNSAPKQCSSKQWDLTILVRSHCFSEILTGISLFLNFSLL